MSSIFGLSSSDSSSNFFDTYFGTSSSSSSSSTSSSLVSSLGDLKMIQSGVYKKALKAYYSSQDSDSDADTISGSGTTDSKTKLSLVKAASQKLNKAAMTLVNKDYSSAKDEDKKDNEDLLSDVKSFVSSYNSTLSGTKDLNSYTILQTEVWATERMSASEGLLNKVGITIKDDNSLELDEDTFKSADRNDIKALFSGSGSLAYQIAQKASTMTNQSANQIAVNSGKTLYTSYGTYN